MNETEILIIGRALERILIVLICGASLGFGWNLFREGIVKNRQAEFSKGEWKVALKQAGPAIFFALFACVGLVVAVSSPLNLGQPLEPKSRASPVSTAGEVIGSYDAPEGMDATTAREIKAIKTLTHLSQSDRSPRTSQEEVNAGESRYPITRTIRKLF